jgi:hypothetical protein
LPIEDRQSAFSKWNNNKFNPNAPGAASRQTDEYFYQNAHNYAVGEDGVFIPMIGDKMQIGGAVSDFHFG